METKTLFLRVPANVHAEITSAAAEERRSANILITLIIEQWLNDRKARLDPPVDYVK